MFRKTYFSQAIFYLVLLIALFTWDSAIITTAYPHQQFAPPSQVILQMHALNSKGMLDPTIPDTRCYSVVTNREKHGCTSIVNDPSHAYPFNSDSVTLSLESHVINGIQQGYLHNVTPHEVALTVSSQGNKTLSCVKAQAVAARTFAYDQLQHGATINNSTDYQVYIPYRYHNLTTTQQQRIDDAVSEILYMTASGSTDPIRAHYGEDNAEWTKTGGERYLKSVYDPISAAYGDDEGTDNGGMSSQGCSRWGFGHTSSWGADDPNRSGSQYPHDSNSDGMGGYGDFWSVRHDNALQILTHYYSDI